MNRSQLQKVNDLVAERDRLVDVRGRIKDCNAAYMIFTKPGDAKTENDSVVAGKSRGIRFDISIDLAVKVLADRIAAIDTSLKTLGMNEPELALVAPVMDERQAAS